MADAVRLGQDRDNDMTRRDGVRRRGFLVASLLTLALAACAQPVTRPTGPTTAAPPPPPPPPPVADERHRVAVLVPTTGANASLGQSIANAANLALLDSGSQRIRLTVYNTATGAAAAAQKAIADGNRLFLGPLLAPDVRAVTPAARQAGVPILAFSNDVSLAGGGTWVLGFQPSQSVERVVAYAREHGVGRLGALIPTGAYGERVSRSLVDAARDAGVTVSAMVTYNRDAQSVQEAIRKLGGGAPAPGGTPRPAPFEALLIADTGRLVVTTAPLLARAGLGSVRLLGTELWNTEPGLAQVSRLNGAWFASVPDATFRQLETRYRERFGSRPYRLASLGYDSVLLINRIGARWATGEAFPTGALLGADGFGGIDGIFRFKTDGTVERALEVQQIGPGGFTTIAPAARSFGR